MLIMDEPCEVTPIENHRYCSYCGGVMTGIMFGIRQFNIRTGDPILANITKYWACNRGGQAYDLHDSIEVRE